MAIALTSAARQAEETTRLLRLERQQSLADKAPADINESENVDPPSEIPRSDPHIRQRANIGNLADREAATAADLAKKKEDAKRKKKDKKRAKDGKPEELTAIKNDSRMGYDTSDSKKIKRITNIYPTAEWTEDPRNPCASFFYEGWAVGVPRSTISELQQFEETDWVCDDDEAEMSFDTGPTNIIPANREIIPRDIEDLPTQTG